MENSSRYFKNTSCEYFPCHTLPPDREFNCLFCYCPLYGRNDCGGKFSFTENGVKDCSECLLPHAPDSWERIVGKLSQSK